MANLRELLGKETLTSVQSGTSITGLNDGKTFIFHPYCNIGNCEQNYHDYCINYWCVPCGTTHMTFEIWGGGGSGAGACCCQQGHPGGLVLMLQKLYNIHKFKVDGVINWLWLPLLVVQHVVVV